MNKLEKFEVKYQKWLNTQKANGWKNFNAEKDINAWLRKRAVLSKQTYTCDICHKTIKAKHARYTGLYGEENNLCQKCGDLNAWQARDCKDIFVWGEYVGAEEEYSFVEKYNSYRFAKRYRVQKGLSNCTNKKNKGE